MRLWPPQGAEAINLPKVMLRRIDKECKRRNMTCTQFVMEVLELWFQGQEERRRLLSGDGWERKGSMLEE